MRAAPCSPIVGNVPAESGRRLRRIGVGMLLVILSVPSAITVMAVSFVAVIGVMPEQHTSHGGESGDTSA